MIEFNKQTYERLKQANLIEQKYYEAIDGLESLARLEFDLKTYFNSKSKYSKLDCSDSILKDNYLRDILYYIQYLNEQGA